MSAHTITTNTSSSTQGLKLRKGWVKIYASTSVYWTVGENPVASADKCAMLRAGETIELKIPVNCSKLAVLAVNESGYVSVTDFPGAKASCSY